MNKRFFCAFPALLWTSAYGHNCYLYSSCHRCKLVSAIKRRHSVLSRSVLRKDQGSTHTRLVFDRKVCQNTMKKKSFLLLPCCLLLTLAVAFSSATPIAGQSITQKEHNATSVAAFAMSKTSPLTIDSDLDAYPTANFPPEALEQ